LGESHAAADNSEITSTIEASEQSRRFMTSFSGKELTTPSLAENPEFARERLVSVGDVIRTLRVSAHATIDCLQRGASEDSGAHR
jgi:hypothetical protein